MQHGSCKKSEETGWRQPSSPHGVPTGFLWHADREPSVRAELFCGGRTKALSRSVGKKIHQSHLSWSAAAGAARAILRICLFWLQESHLHTRMDAGPGEEDVRGLDIMSQSSGRGPGPPVALRAWRHEGKLPA